METVDEEFLDGAMGFIDQAHADDKPFFVWWNSTRMHVFTHLKEESQGVTGLGVYPDGMVEHDGHIGQFLDKLDELGIADDTIVMYSTDNGAEVMTWPDGGATPFRGEKATNWEGGFRVPMVIRWPGVIEPGTINNEIVRPRGLAARPSWPRPAIRTSSRSAGPATRVGDRTYKVHLDGVNLLPAFTDPPARTSGRASCSRTGATTASSWPSGTSSGRSSSRSSVRHGLARLGGAVRRAAGAAHVQHPLGSVRARPGGHLLRPVQGGALFIVVPAAALAAEWLMSFREFPPRMKPGSFSLDRVMEQVTAPAGKN